MSFHCKPMFLSVLAVIPLFALVSSDGGVTPQLYWKSVLPDTAMPKVVRDLLKPDPSGDNGNGQSGVNKFRISADTDQKVKRIKQKQASPFLYDYITDETQQNDNTGVTPFFLEKDLQSGKTVSLDFTENEPTGFFLPRQSADTKPFSSDKLPEIFRDFSVTPGSEEADTMKQTIEECENRGIKGEEKYCATSLESMIDFVTSKLGNGVQANSTEAPQQARKQEYIIEDGITKTAAQRFVVCHKQDYAYAVFYCHSTQNSTPYLTRLRAADGTRIKALAVCHADTSAWNPKHVAFRMLMVEPGTVPVCHFLPQSHIVWVKK